MKHAILIAALALFSASASATPLKCMEDTNTRENFCFADNGIRGNAKVREGKLYKGGDGAIEETGYTMRVYCEAGILELIDRKNVVFARNVPTASHIRGLVRAMCEHGKVKADPKLGVKA